MVNNVRLVQIIGFLLSVVILFRVINSQESLLAKAQNVSISPSFNCLGPCASGSPSSSQPATSTTPKVSTPCQAAVTQAHKKKGGRERGGFLGIIFRFFMEILVGLLGLDTNSFTSGSLGRVSSSSSSAASSSDSSSSSSSSDGSVSSSSSPCDSSSASSSSTASASASPSDSTTQKLGVCGIPAPAPGPNVVLTSSDSTAALDISSGGTADSPKIYDGQCHTVGTITIKANYVVVQNFKVNATGQYGIQSDGNGITIQNNDIKGIHPSGDGDLNAITFFGNDTKILYNTAIDFVTGSPGGSHTDAIQTWVSDSHPVASTNVTIQGNKFTGPANPSRDNNTPSIHQCVMAEGLNAGGNSGGSGNPKNWLIADNYFSDSWNQCIKLDGIENVSVTRNEFAGSSDKVIDVSPASTGVKYYSDNKVTGSYKNGVGTTATQGSGPTKL